MIGISFLRVVTAGVASVCLLGASMEPAHGAQGQAPTFRSGVTVVPLDIRVVDRKGGIVNDLTKEDFLVFEDGVQQEVVHFERRVLIPGTPGSLAARSSTAPFALDVPNRRVFYIELSRLWLGNPQFGLIEALTKFLRQRLLPQDHVAVGSFGRTTDLTTDHEAVAKAVERLAALHGEIHSSAAKGMAMYGWRRQPADSPIRQALDAAFAPASSGLRLSLRPETEFAKILDVFASNFVTLHGGRSMGSSLSNTGTLSSAEVFRSDMLALLGAVEYLRFIEGEKHLVYFPLIAPAAVEDDREITRIANDARVAIHNIHGVYGLPPSGSVNLFADMSAKNIAEWTGGSAFIRRWPDEALAKIDEVTRGGYLLAYSPGKAAADERYRKIVVRLKRQDGAQVMVRDAYLSTNRPAVYDPSTDAAKQQMLTVAEFPGAVDDLGIVLASTTATPTTVTAHIEIDLSRVKFTTDADRNVAKLELAVFCADSRERLTGQKWTTLDLKLKNDTLTKALAEGFRQAVTVPVTTRVRWVKAVVYDYGGSRAGAAVGLVK